MWPSFKRDKLKRCQEFISDGAEKMCDMYHKPDFMKILQTTCTKFELGDDVIEDVMNEMKIINPDLNLLL